MFPFPSSVLAVYCGLLLGILTQTFSACLISWSKSSLIVVCVNRNQSVFGRQSLAITELALCSSVQFIRHKTVFELNPPAKEIPLFLFFRGCQIIRPACPRLWSAFPLLWRCPVHITVRESSPSVTPACFCPRLHWGPSRETPGGQDCVWVKSCTDQNSNHIRPVTYLGCWLLTTLSVTVLLGDVRILIDA